MLVLSLTTVFRSFAQTDQKILVIPNENIFSTDPEAPNYMEVGDTFSVNISAADWAGPGLWGYELKLGYDNTLINAISAEIPEGHFFTPETSPGIFIVDPGTLKEDYVSFALTCMAPEPGKTESGTIATVTFEVLESPPTAGTLSCDLDLYDVTLVDPDATAIPTTAYDVEDGYYEFSAPKPKMPWLKVEPEYVTAEDVGDSVVVNVTINELLSDWRLVGVEWKLSFDTSILETMSEWIIEGDFLIKTAEEANKIQDGHGTYFHAIVEESHILSFSLYFKYPWPPALYPEGSGTLATITFNATYKPTLEELVAKCDLTLSDVLLVDVETNVIPYDRLEPGRYEIAVAPPPWLSVEPKSYDATELGEEFGLTVFINDLDSDWRMVGTEFKIRYDMALLELENITEGGFMKYFAMLSGAPEPYTWFQAYVDEDPTSRYGIIGIIILPLENGTWPGPFPDTEDYGAPGDFAIVQFKGIHQDPDLDLESDIYLDAIVLVNTDAKEIPYDAARTAEEGTCKYTIARALPPVHEFGIDLYTQLNDGYNGKGFGIASDAFPPQGVVELCAEVRYRFDPVPGKLVAYEISMPTGIYYASAESNDTGVAVFEYSIPGSELCFGLWTVTASVDLAGTVWTDTLYFLVGYLIQPVEVGVFDEEYTMGEYLGFYKGETVNVNVTYLRICWQDPRLVMNTITKDAQGDPITNDLVFRLTITDELKQPVAAAVLNDTIPLVTGDLTAFVLRMEGLDWTQIKSTIRDEYPDMIHIRKNGIRISASAYSGIATIRANILTDDPGVPYCPEETYEIWIKKKE